MPKILIAEDDDLSRDMLSRRLSRKGYEVVTAEDGRQAVALAREHRPDLILMDLAMPEVDGWEATQWLRRDERTQDIPLIALTAYRFDGMRDAVVSAGFDDFEPKPIELPRLLEKIRAHLAGPDPEP